MNATLADLPMVDVDPEPMRARHVTRRLVEESGALFTSRLTIAEMAGVSPRTVDRVAAGVPVSVENLDRISRALDGHWTPRTTDTRVEDMRRCLNNFLTNIRKQPIGVS